MSLTLHEDYHENIKFTIPYMNLTILKINVSSPIQINHPRYQSYHPKDQIIIINAEYTIPNSKYI